MLGSKWFKEIGDLAKYGLDLEFENIGATNGIKLSVTQV